METPRELGAENRKAIFVGVFGKHPGWNDHIEENEEVPDLGLRTESLVWAKSLLYTQGIGRNIESGAWEKLPPEQVLEGFDHTFLWQRNGGFIAGSLWSSRDGKGRRLYPMVVSAHVTGVTLHWVLTVLFSRLVALQMECQQVQTAREVGSILSRAREDLALALHGPSRSVPSTREFISRFARHPQFGADQEGLSRVLSRFQAQAVQFAPGRFNARNSAGSRGVAVRVPAAGLSKEDIFCAWSETLGGYLDFEAPLLLISPTGKNWMDVIVGEPSPEDLFCLRATLARLPSVSEIPFHVDEAKRKETRARIDGLIRGDTPAPSGSKLGRWLGSLFKA
ncbi:MAG TPA: hypothetical protein VGR78_17460 [Verrucomicrobiae bacterium]|nr:hypothetical protein [Verrucomicrobiae bacterium]